MIIYLDDSLIDNIDIRDNVAIEYILQASREGKHKVVGSRNVVSHIKDTVDLTLRNKHQLDVIYNKVSQDFQLIQHVSWYIRILPSSSMSTVSSDRNINIINLPLNYIDDSRILQDTKVVGENSNDSKLFEYTGKTYIKINRFGKLRIRMTHVGGGGDTTASVFSDIQAAKCVCLCVVDSDKKSPNDTIKGTAAKVAAVGTTNFPLSHIQILDVHEIENIIPTAHIKDAFINLTDYAKAVDKLKVLDDYKDLRCYADFKKGVSCKSIYQMGNVPMKYWSNTLYDNNYLLNDCLKQYVCLNDNVCICEILPKLGDEVLVRTLKLYGEVTIDKICQSIDVDVHKSWCDIGKLIFSWCIGDENLVTI